MSKIGKNPITVPQGVTVKKESDLIIVDGPKGQLVQKIRPEITVTIESDRVLVTRRSDARIARALHGLSRSLIFNMVTGVSSGWTKTLELVGVGYRAQKQGENLVLTVGFSHPVVITPQPGIQFSIAENKVTVTGIDKAQVGQVAANIRHVRPPEPYKGKGIRYSGEHIIRKQGKSSKVGK